MKGLGIKVFAGKLKKPTTDHIIRRPPTTDHIIRRPPTTDHRPLGDANQLYYSVQITALNDHIDHFSASGIEYNMVEIEGLRVVLVVGSGGREHAIAECLARSEMVSSVFVSPG